MLRKGFQVLMIYAVVSSALNPPEYDYTEQIQNEFAYMITAFRNSVQKLSEETLSINQNDLKSSTILEQHPKVTIQDLPDDEDQKRNISIKCRFSTSFEISVPMVTFNISGLVKKDGVTSYIIGKRMTAVFTMKWDELSPKLQSDITVKAVQFVGEISSLDDAWSTDETPSSNQSFEKITSFVKENLLNITEIKINNHIMQKKNNRQVLSTAFAVCMHPQKKFTKGNNHNAYYMKSIKLNESTTSFHLEIQSLKLEQLWNMESFDVTLKHGSFDFKLQHLNLMGEIRGLFKMGESESITNITFSSPFCVSNLLVDGSARINSTSIGSKITASSVKLFNVTDSCIYSKILSRAIKKIFEKNFISLTPKEYANLSITNLA